MKKCVFLVCVFIFFASHSFAQNTLVFDANRRTANRFLKLAEECLGQKLYSQSYSQSQMGLNYDSSISDLWYISAASLHAQKKEAATVLPLVSKALTLNNWVDYNKDAARSLYAELLCTIGDYEKAISVLDAAPFLYSADAEYIRSKSLYLINSKNSLENARNKINAARRIYPEDTRFAHLFFKHEYAKNEKPLPPIVRNIADAFIAKMPTYDNPFAELEIYAAIFSEGELKERALKAFTAHNMEHPLYAKEAVQANLLSEKDAIEYFFKFADKTIPLDMLVDFASCITGSNEKALLKEHLVSYHGLLTIDTNQNLDANLFIQYERGRPAKISYDKENDGVIEWSVPCDFGVPLSASFQEMNFTYGTYPVVVKAVKDDKTFYFSNETLSFSPFELVTEKKLKQYANVDFFIPTVNSKTVIPSLEFFSKRASQFSIPTYERKNSYVVFYLADGIYQNAEYYESDKIYARTSFENGWPFMRAVDNDGDGIFETTELYEKDLNGAYSLENRKKANELLFASLSERSLDLCLKAIHIDENADTISDFIEEYGATGGVVRYWDTTGDRKWNIRYEKFPQKSNEALVEVASFYTIPDKKYISVTTYDKKPGKVLVDEKEVPVYKGRNGFFYWLGEIGTSEEEQLILLRLGKETSQGVSVLVQAGSKRFLAVKVADYCYASVMPPSAFETNVESVNVENTSVENANVESNFNEVF
ncbi:MAG: tetratricopeptide repeat protein [Treponema sp.]|nr:tetratricopeptide repeat protein [Treponema sp.]